MSDIAMQKAMKIGEGPAIQMAFPGWCTNKAGDIAFGIGMTLRDWFAGMSLSGMQARDSYDIGLATPAQRARVAYADADAMLKESEKK